MRTTRSLLVVFSIAFLCAAGLNAQNNSSVLTKVTATWCPNCGTWGWDYMEEMKAMYANDSKVTLLGVHHSGDLRNNVSSWFADNLDFFYQPVFFHNNSDLNVTRNNWEDKVGEMAGLIEDFASGNSSAEIGFNSAYIMNNEIHCSVNIDASKKSNAEFYLAVYVFENNVVNNQASQGLAMHPNVLRDVMSDNNYGDLIDTGNAGIQTEFSMPVDPSWNGDNLGLLAILWNVENNSFVLQNSGSIHNIGLLSSSEEVLDGEDIKIAYLPNGFRLNTGDQDEYQLYFYNANAQLLQQQKFINETQLETSNLPAGLYSVHLRKGDKVYTQQVFVN